MCVGGTAAHRWDGSVCRWDRAHRWDDSVCRWGSGIHRWDGSVCIAQKIWHVL